MLGEFAPLVPHPVPDKYVARLRPVSTAHQFHRPFSRFSGSCSKLYFSVVELLDQKCRLLQVELVTVVATIV